MAVPSPCSLRRAPGCALLLLAVACQHDEGPLPVVGGDGFFDRPWPSAERAVQGHPDYTGYPLQGELGIVDTYLDLAESIRGFATNGPVYVRFETPLDTDRLPSPEDSVEDGSALILVGVEPGSRDYGRRIPVTWSFQEEATTWQPSDLLAVQPVWGFPLRPTTTYALIVTTDVAGPAPDFDQVWREDDPRHATFADLQGLLPDLGLSERDVAVATVFTTQNPVDEMARMARVLHEDLPVAALDQPLTRWNKTLWFRAYEGTMRVPLWQHGSKPYLTDGGGFVFDDSGDPVMAEWEEVKFTFTIPMLSEAPEGGWPVVINSHGTGGDYRSHAEGATGLSPAAVLAKGGMALLAISQPLHADRGTGIDPTLVSFNYLNPEAARATFRQGALDQVWLAEVLARQSHCFTTDDGLSACTDPDRVAFLGHSQGGIVGAMALPFLAGRASDALLSGAGGGLSVTMVQRDTEEVDVTQILADQLDFSPDEVLTETHPLVGLVQHLSEVTDPINYSRYWSEESGWWETAPVSVLMTEGTEDPYTPPPTIEALAGAAGLPILDPVAQYSVVAELRGLVGQALPTRANLQSWDDEPVSGGLAQYPGQGHFPIFDDGDAAALYQNFLETGLAGEAPEIANR